MELDFEYSSSCILILSNPSNDKISIIRVDDFDIGFKTTNMIVIDTFTEGLSNEDVEAAIRQVLNDDYDIDYEIELYHDSRLYAFLKENEEA